MDVFTRYIRQRNQILILFVVNVCHFYLSTLVNGQMTVSIHLSRGETPNEGEFFYPLNCTVTSFEFNQYRTLAWFFNGEMITWGGDIRAENARGRMSVQEEFDDEGQLYSYLSIHEVFNIDTGKYQCSVVEGDLTNFFVRASAKTSVFVNGMIPSGFYFPSNHWPVCYPSVNITVLLDSEMTIGCFSMKGNPPVNIYLLQQSSAVTRLIDYNVAYELEYTFKVSAEQNNVKYTCLIQRNAVGQSLPPMSRSYSTGHITVGLIEQKIVQIPQGANAIFSCRKPEGETIIWSTEPAIESSRMEMANFDKSSVITLKNLQFEDNDTTVNCRIGPPYNLHDKGKLVVVVHSNTKAPETTPTVPLKTSTVAVSFQALTPTKGVAKDNESVSASPRDNSMDQSVLAGIVIAGALLVIIAISLLIVVVCRRKKYKFKWFTKGDTVNTRDSHTVTSELSQNRQENGAVSSNTIENQPYSPQSSSTEHTECIPTLQYKSPNSSIHGIDNQLGNACGKVPKKAAMPYLVVDLTDHRPKKVHSCPPSGPAPPPPNPDIAPSLYAIPHDSSPAEESVTQAATLAYSSPVRKSRLSVEALPNYKVPDSQSKCSSLNVGKREYASPSKHRPVDPGSVTSTSYALPSRRRRSSETERRTPQYSLPQTKPRRHSTEGVNRTENLPPKEKETSLYDSPNGSGPPSPSNSTETFFQMYASPRKNRLTDNVSLNTGSPQYATVHPDPENPIIRETRNEANSMQ